MTAININIQVKIKLTQYGRNILKQHYSEFPSLAKLDETGYFKSELWNIMYIFGEHLYNGSKQIIEENELLLDS